MDTILNFTPEIIDDAEIEIDVITSDENKNKHNNLNNNNNNNDNDNDNKKLAIKKIGSKNFRTTIIEKYIRPNIITDIKNNFLWRKRWKKIATTSFCLSEILGLIQTGLAFSAASFNLVLISYLAGMFGVLCIALNRFGSYSKNESSDNTNQLNDILITVGIKDKIPNLMYHDLQDTNDNH
jgi:hypothetical protein